MVSRCHSDTGAYRQLAKVMAELGWAAVRFRDFNRRGFKEQCRATRVPISLDGKKVARYEPQPS